MSAVHPVPHPLAGRQALLLLAEGGLPASVVTVEDWWERATGAPFMEAFRARVTACRVYADRACTMPAADVLTLQEVVLVQDVEGTHHAVHASELHPYVEPVPQLCGLPVELTFDEMSLGSHPCVVEIDEGDELGGGRHSGECETELEQAGLWAALGCEDRR